MLFIELIKNEIGDRSEVTTINMAAVYDYYGVLSGTMIAYFISTLLAYNRNVSYLTFFLNELYNYLNLKTDDDIYYYKIRNDYLELEKYINKINNLKTYLSK